VGIWATVDLADKQQVVDLMGNGFLCRSKTKTASVIVARFVCFAFIIIHIFYTMELCLFPISVSVSTLLFFLANTIVKIHADVYWLEFKYIYIYIKLLAVPVCKDNQNKYHFQRKLYVF